MKHLIEIILSLIAIPDKVELFDTPVIVKKNGVSIFECWGIAIQEGVWLMDDQGEWHQWEPTDRNAQEVIDALYNRLRTQKKAA